MIPAHHIDAYSIQRSSLLPPLPSLPTLPSIEELKAKAGVDAVASKLDEWATALASYRASLNALGVELSRAPGSTYDSILKNRMDTTIHPEVEWDGQVRYGGGLGLNEEAFLRERKRFMVTAFAKMMGVEEKEVDERDIPVIAVAGSGGGYRAMVSTLGSISGAKESGVWDIVSYASAVSGSCWALSLLYSLGGGNIDATIEHVKNRITSPFLHANSLELLTKKPTSEYLLAGAILKESNTAGELSLVDAYGTLVASRLFVPSLSTVPLSPSHLKLSSQRSYIDDGSNPLPIYCAIRHEIPQMDLVDEEDRKIAKKGASDEEKEAGRVEKRRLVGEGSWQWFEMTPYEVGCAEIGAWIPTWSLGRTFDGGKNTERIPEMSLTILSGIFASAFCATLFNYYQEVKPLISTLPYFNTIEPWLLGNYQNSLDAVHPFPPSELPNFLKGIPPDKLREGTPSYLTKLDTLGFMDAGANLNIPYVPLFRRDADLILAFDASADSQDLWFSRAATYAQALDLKTWPRVSPTLFDKSSSSSSSSSDEAANAVDDAKAQESITQPTDAPASNPQVPPTGSAPTSALPSEPSEPELGICNIWIGSTNEEEGGCRNDDPSVEEVRDRDGITLVYFPLRGGEGDLHEVWSTWRFDYPENETMKLVQLASDNFKSSDEKLKKVIRGIWLRKRQQRLGAASRSPSS